MSNFNFPWYDRHDHEFQVEVSVSKYRKSTPYDPEEPVELELISCQAVVGNQLSADLLGMLDEQYIQQMESDAEIYYDSMGECA